MKWKLGLLIVLLLCTVTIPNTGLTENLSGIFGNNISWSLDTSTGVMVVSGSGNMEDLPFGSNWEQWKTYVKQINIENGVTTIGAYTFNYCNNLEKVNLPETVTKLGEAAFENCAKLQSINIPSGVTEIGMYAFEGCSALDGITLPDNLSIIKYGSFGRCTSLSYMNLLLVNAAIYHL